jgi:hypothetical protein
VISGTYTVFLVSLDEVLLIKYMELLVRVLGARHSRCGQKKHADPGIPTGQAVVLSGISGGELPPSWEIRSLTASDIADCENLHTSIHGYTRTNELQDEISTGAPVVVPRGGRVRAYMAAPTIWLANHGVAETEEDMQALLLGAPRVTKQPISFLMPIRRAELFRWCLTQGFRAIRPMTLMAMGEYREPQGSYFPSVLF